MSEYFPVEPIGLGTADVECFASYFCRLAFAHTLSIISFDKHLTAWCKRTDGIADGSRIFESLRTLNGYSPTSLMAHHVVERATSISKLSRTSLSDLATAAPRNGRGFARRLRAWCPACLVEDLAGDLGAYERLLWVLPNIARCSHHKLALLTACTTCGAPQSNYHASGNLGLCCKCAFSLDSKERYWVYQPKPSFCEAASIELVYEISSGGLVVTEDAFQKFAVEIRTILLDGKRRAYGKIFGSSYCKHIRREQMRPSYHSMLQQSHSLGVSLVNILSDPVEAARAAGVLSLAEQICIDQRRIRLPPSTIKAIEDRLRSDIEVQADSMLVSLRALAREFQVSTGAIENRFGSLVRQYQLKRKTALNSIRAAERRRLMKALNAGLLDDYRAKRIPSIDELARQASQAAGVGIRAARVAIVGRLLEG